jgi:hypothetical protein
MTSRDRVASQKIEILVFSFLPSYTLQSLQNCIAKKIFSRCLKLRAISAFNTSPVCLFCQQKKMVQFVPTQTGVAGAASTWSSQLKATPPARAVESTTFKVYLKRTPIKCKYIQAQTKWTKKGTHQEKMSLACSLPATKTQLSKFTHPERITPVPLQPTEVKFSQTTKKK